MLRVPGSGAPGDLHMTTLAKGGCHGTREVETTSAEALAAI